MCKPNNNHLMESTGLKIVKNMTNKENCKCQRTSFILSSRGYNSYFDMLERERPHILTLCPCQLKELEENGYTASKITEWFNEKPEYDEYGMEVYKYEEKILEMFTVLPEEVVNDFLS